MATIIASILIDKPIRIDLLKTEMQVLDRWWSTNERDGHIDVAVSDGSTATEEQALAIYAAHDAEATTPEEDLRAVVADRLNGLEGTALTALSQAQLLLLVGALLYRAGGLNPDGTLKNPLEWMR